MRSAIVFALAAAAALVVDMRLSVFGARADTLTVVVYRFALTRTHLAGVSFGALAGFAEDSLVSLSIGPSLFGKSVAGFATPYLSHAFFRWTPLLGFFGAMAVTWLCGMAEFAVHLVFGGIEGSFLGGLYPLFAQGLMNGILGAVLSPGEKGAPDTKGGR